MSFRVITDDLVSVVITCSISGGVSTGSRECRLDEECIKVGSSCSLLALLLIIPFRMFIAKATQDFFMMSNPISNFKII